MSFIITMYVREGIVMASDSRLTLNAQTRKDDQPIVQMAVAQSDSNYKTFLAPGNIGITTYGAADIQGIPIGGYIESFMNEILADYNLPVDEVPARLMAYFRRNLTRHPISSSMLLATSRLTGNWNNKYGTSRSG